MQSINWFPGHMAKARREMTDSLKKVDAVVELVDARLPIASANPMLRELIGAKPRIVVMTRIDLADPEQTRRWQEYFRMHNTAVVAVDAKSGNGVRNILPALETAAAAKRDRDAKRGIRPRALRTMVVGIPNVGKSSLINRLAGNASTKTGDRPGITKTQQWIRLGRIELLDTPGVLWPKLEDEHGAYALAISGAIKSDVLDLQAVSAYLILWLSQHYPQVLFDRYQVSEAPSDPWVDAATAWEAVEPTLVEIAKSRGLVKSGGVPDTERSAELLVRETQTGKLGRLSFEWAPSTTDRAVDET